MLYDSDSKTVNLRLEIEFKSPKSIGFQSCFQGRLVKNFLKFFEKFFMKDFGGVASDFCMTNRYQRPSRRPSPPRVGAYLGTKGVIRRCSTIPDEGMDSWTGLNRSSPVINISDP